MHASPIVPGVSYRVKYQGRTVDVLAPHGCAAICALLNFIGVAATC